MSLSFLSLVSCFRGWDCIWRKAVGRWAVLLWANFVYSYGFTSFWSRWLSILVGPRTILSTQKNGQTRAAASKEGRACGRQKDDMRLRNMSLLFFGLPMSHSRTRGSVLAPEMCGFVLILMPNMNLNTLAHLLHYPI